MTQNSISTNRLKIVIGGVTFEIEGSQDLIREGLSYAKENILSESALAEAMKILPAEGIKERLAPPPVDEGPNVRDFYANMNPRNNTEAVVVLAFYARQYRNLAEVSETELQPLFNEAGAKLPKDTAQAIRNAARKDCGYLDYTGRTGYYRITNAGVNLVNIELPKRGKRGAQ